MGGGGVAVMFLCDTLWENSIFLLNFFFMFLETSWKGILNNFCLKFIGQFHLFFIQFILFT